nr:MAG TPA: hypothetical protein [Caudoviricetes sp.]
MYFTINVLITKDHQVLVMIIAFMTFTLYPLYTL